MVVDQLLVADVHEWSEVDDSSTEQNKSPSWHDLDEVVAEECGDEGLGRVSGVQSLKVGTMTYSNSGVHVLSEDNALELDDEEVGKLLDIAKYTLEVLVWDGVVLSRSQLARQSLAQDDLASNLQSCGNAQGNVQHSEGISRDWDVACGEDKGDNHGIADGGCAWVLPAKEVVEEGVVVCEVLAGGGLCLWCLAGGCEVAELVLGGIGFVACLLSDGAVGEVLHRLRVSDVVHCCLCVCWVC